MPRFAVVAMVLLLATLVAGAAGAWYAGLLPDDWVADSVAEPPARITADHAAAAIAARDLSMVQQYLADGGDPDTTDAEGETLLNKAVLAGAGEILDVLLAAGADPDLPGKNGLGPLAIAALAGRGAMLDRLMAAREADAVAGARSSARLAAVEGDGGVGRDADATAGAPAASFDFGGPAMDIGPGGAPAAAVLASLTGDGAPQATPPTGPVEPYASMAGLAVAPIPRPQPPAAGVAVAPTAGVGTAGVASDQGTAASAATGTKASWVSAAQRRLGQLGYYRGPVDGVAGSLTADAVKRYQAVAGIAENGVISADLLRRIGAEVDGARGGVTAPPAPADAASRGKGREQAANGVLQQVRNALGQDFNSATHPDALRRYCQENAAAWVYDEAVGRSLFCRDVIGSPPR